MVGLCIEESSSSGGKDFALVAEGLWSRGLARCGMVARLVALSGQVLTGMDMGSAPVQMAPQHGGPSRAATESFR